jgi:phage gp16-like protein
MPLTEEERMAAYEAKRQKRIRLLHVARRELGMDEETWHAACRQVTKKASSKDMTLLELDKMVLHLKNKGFKVRHKTGKSRTHPEGKSRPLSGAAERHGIARVASEHAKIRALWLFLHELGEVKNPAEEALYAYVKRIAHVDSLHFVDSVRAARLIETLKKWAMRVLPQKLMAQVEAINARIAPPHESRIKTLPNEVWNELQRLVSLAFDRQTYDPMENAYALGREVLDALNAADAPKAG